MALFACDPHAPGGALPEGAGDGDAKDPGDADGNGIAVPTTAGDVVFGRFAQPKRISIIDEMPIVIRALRTLIT
jgi:hypothetical protein